MPEVSGAKKAVLLPNIVGFPAVSMVRYARELGTALRRVGPPQWEIEELTCEPVRQVEKWLPAGQGEAWASRAGRFIAYPRLARRTTGDVFHVLDHSHANLIDALPVARTVLTCHDLIPLLAARGLIPIPAGRLTKYTFPLFRLRAMQRCRFVIAGSENTRRDLIEHGGLDPARVVTVYYGVNPVFAPLPSDEQQTVRRAIRQRHGLPEDAACVLQVGTANRYKNTPTLLRALKRLAEQMPERRVYLWRVGADLFEDEAALLTELALDAMVVRVGRVPDDAALADYYRAADVLAFPSLYEGFGLPVIEAMACGTPAVTSNVASLPEVVGEAGLTVPPLEPDRLADALCRVLTDQSLYWRLQERCHERARQFTWERCARDVLAVYARIAAE